MEVRPLKAKVLDSWTIHRIENHLSARSFEKSMHVVSKIARM
jgi:hypothetical protein